MIMRILSRINIDYVFVTPSSPLDSQLRLRTVVSTLCRSPLDHYCGGRPPLEYPGAISQETMLPYSPLMRFWEFSCSFEACRYRPIRTIAYLCHYSLLVYPLSGSLRARAIGA